MILRTFRVLLFKIAGLLPNYELRVIHAQLNSNCLQLKICHANAGGRGFEEQIGLSFVRRTIGRFPIRKRLRFVVGLGYQVAVAQHPLYHNKLIVTVRTPF